jgi:hypothetical protein
MRSLCLSLALSTLLPLTSASFDLPLDCAYGNTADYCKESLGAVTTVVPGSFYIAKLPCPDCPLNPREGDSGYLNIENDLVRNSLAVIH